MRLVLFYSLYHIFTFTCRENSARVLRNVCPVSYESSATSCAGYETSVQLAANTTTQKTSSVSSSISHGGALWTCSVLVNQPMTYEQAKKTCKVSGGRLAWVTDVQAGHMTKLIQDYKDSTNITAGLWIGLTVKKKKLVWDCPFKGKNNPSELWEEAVNKSHICIGLPTPLEFGSVALCKIRGRLCFCWSKKSDQELPFICETTLIINRIRMARAANHTTNTSVTNDNAATDTTREGTSDMQSSGWPPITTRNKIKEGDKGAENQSDEGDSNARVILVGGSVVVVIISAGIAIVAMQFDKNKSKASRTTEAEAKNAPATGKDSEVPKPKKQMDENKFITALVNADSGAAISKTGGTKPPEATLADSDGSKTPSRDSDGTSSGNIGANQSTPESTGNSKELQDVAIVGGKSIGVSGET